MGPTRKPRKASRGHPINDQEYNDADDGVILATLLQALTLGVLKTYFETDTEVPEVGEEEEYVQSRLTEESGQAPPNKMKRKQEEHTPRQGVEHIDTIEAEAAE